LVGWLVKYSPHRKLLKINIVDFIVTYFLCTNILFDEPVMRISIKLDLNLKVIADPQILSVLSEVKYGDGQTRLCHYAFIS